MPPRNAATTTDVPLEEREMSEVWEEYKRTGSETLRNFLMTKFLHLVKYNADRIHAKLPVEVDVEDLHSAGVFGLMDAIDGFDTDRGVKFETFCAPRIRGAILDELRSMDWVPRLVRSRTAKVEGARKQLAMEFGRNPTDDEIADKLDMSMADFRKVERDSKTVGVVSIHRKWFETDSNKDVREVDVLRDARQPNPLTQVQKRDLRDLMTRGLSRAERLILILYYYEEMTMKEIGQTLDLSESRVSQMHSSILARLKAQMAHRGPDLDGEEE